jgi:hypothetical protein
MLQFQEKFFGFIRKVLKFVPPNVEKKLQLTTALENF